MTNIVTNAIAANLGALVLTLGRARDIAHRAAEAIATGKRNVAIGTLVDLEQLLPQADALARAIMALHRGDGSSG